MQLFLTSFLIYASIGFTEGNLNLMTWEQFKINFNKSFNSIDDENSRFEVFNETLRTISRHNYEQHTFRLGINQFSDMTFDEFAAMNTFNEPFVALPNNVPYNPIIEQHESAVELPDSFDWRNFNAVSDVKDQKSCGCCYAMSAISAIESHLKIKTGKSLDLSVQEIIDCAGDFETYGCYGGFDHRVLDYIIDKEGLTLADDYPFEEKQEQCRRDNHKKIEISLKGYIGVVATVGPIAISLEINHESFMRYSSGIYQQDECDYNTNHAALLVGYGSDDGVNYWIVKNSFGTTWGEAGYIRVIRNLLDQCGITQYPFYPLIE